jgi:hypothetical protein
MSEQREYPEITTEEFHNRLNDKIADEAATLLAIPGIAEILSKHFNNEILEEYEEDNEPTMTYENAVDTFTADFLPSIPADDSIMQREAFNNWTDSLCKDGQITIYQYENWDNPF